MGETKTRIECNPSSLRKTKIISLNSAVNEIIYVDGDE